LAVLVGGASESDALDSCSVMVQTDFNEESDALESEE
jgi:hypothetical protein